jgi:hypothetical protein
MTEYWKNLYDEMLTKMGPEFVQKFDTNILNDVYTQTSSHSRLTFPKLKKEKIQQTKLSQNTDVARQPNISELMESSKNNDTLNDEAADELIDECKIDNEVLKNSSKRTTSNKLPHSSKIYVQDVMYV